MFPNTLPIDQSPMKKLNSLFYSHPREMPARRRKHVGTIGYGRWLGSHRQPCREPVLALAQVGGLLLSFPRISPLPSSSMAQLARVLLVPSHPLTYPHPVALWCHPVPSVLIQGNGPCLTCLRLLPTCHPKQPWEETSTICSTGRRVSAWPTFICVCSYPY